MQFIVMNGRVYDLDLNTFRDVVMNKTFASLYVLFVIFISVMRPSIYGHPAGLPMLMVYWAVSIFGFVAIWYLQCWILSPPNPRWFPKRVHSVFLHIIPLLVLVLVTKSFSGYWFDGDYRVLPTPWDWTRNFILTAIFELIYTTWLLPAEVNPVDENSPRADEPEPVVVEVGASSFYLHDIIYLRSVEHYVEVIGKRGNEMPRAVLRDILDQFEPQQGFQPHRSYWAAKGEIVGVVKSDGKTFLEMSNGDRLPISRSRVNDFNEWQRDHGAIVLKKKTGR